MAGLDEEKLESLNESYDTKIISKASEAKTLDTPRWKTGIFELDRVLGGGVPRGRFISAWGQNGDGKSTLGGLLSQAGQDQCRYCNTEIEDGQCQTEDCESEPIRVAWFDVEHTLDREWIADLGCDLDQLYVVQSEYMEQGVDIIHSMIRQQDIDFIVVDSIAAMTPTEEIEKSAEDDLMGTHAKTINSACRKWQSAINSAGMDSPLKPTIMLINQVRQDIGTTFGDNRIKPGGKGQDFVTSIDLWLYSRNETPFDDDELGTKKVELDFTTYKNKTFRPGMRGQVEIATADWPDEDIHKGDVLQDPKYIFDRARDMDMIEKDSSNWVWVPTGEAFNTYKELRKEVRENYDWRETQDKILQTYLKGHYDPEEDEDDTASLEELSEEVDVDNDEE